MKISNPSNDKKLPRLWSLSLIAFALILGLILGELGILKATTTFLYSKIEQTFNGSSQPLPSLVLDMNFQDYNQILAQRQEALESRVYFANEADFVTTNLTVNNETFPVKMRLRPGYTTHLADDDKWNFELILEAGSIQGLNHIYLIDPADNNWLNEWGYQAHLKQAGLPYTNYSFINLTLNGDDLGVYALQEAPTTTQNRTSTADTNAVVYFDPTMLWQNIAYFDGNEALAATEPTSNFDVLGWQFLDVYASSNGPSQDANELAEEQAVALLTGYQQNHLPTTAVFDVDKYGLFLAISDLWGAGRATNLENLHFYFNPLTERLEPIGFNGQPNLGGGRINLSSATFNDPVLQQAYIDALLTITTPEYLNLLQTHLEDSWQQKEDQLPNQVATHSIWQSLADQQLILQRSLHPQQPVLAHYEIERDGINSYLLLKVVNLANVPIELVGLDNNGIQFLEFLPEWVEGDHPTEKIVLPSFQKLTNFSNIKIPLSQLEENDLTATNLQIGTRVFGTDFITYVPIRPSFTSQNEGSQ